MINFKQILVLDQQNNSGFSQHNLIALSSNGIQYHSKTSYSDLGVECTSLFLLLMQILPNSFSGCNVDAIGKRNKAELNSSRQTFTSFIDLVEWVYYLPYDFQICAGTITPEQNSFLNQVINYRLS